MKNIKSSRNVKIEVIRLIACFAVIWYHIRELPFKANGELSETAVFFECICTICVMTFFLITGFFIYNSKGKILSDWAKLLKKTFFNLFIPFVIISVICLIFHEYLISRQTFLYCINNIDINNIISKLLISFKTFDVASLPGTAAHLWYVYSYIIIILVYPITRFILTKTKRKFVYLILAILTICMIINDYHLFYGDPTYNKIFQIIHKPIYYSAFGFVLYNDIIKKYIDDKLYDKNTLILNKKIFVISIVVYILTFISLFITQINYYWGTNNGYVYTSWLSLYSLMLTSAFILIIYNINIERFLNDSIKTIIFFLSSKTLGIYLIHYLIITKLISIGFQSIWTMNRPNILYHFAFYIFYSLFIFILSLLFVSLIDLVKKGGIMAKRKDYLKWDEYFMGLAVMASLRSKDPNTQVGCCLVDNDNRILSLGYNGFPIGCSDDEFPWEREGASSYDTKYNYVCHAELNAILNYKGNSLKGAKAYVNQFPCNECAKAIIQSGIKTIIYLDDKYASTDGVKSSKRMFNAAGVKYKKFKSQNKEIMIKL